MDQEPGAIYELALEAEKRGELDRAEGLYNRFKSECPTDPRGPNKLGVVCALRRDMQGADKYFREALHLDSKYVPALTNMGNLLLESGQVDDAISYYEEALHWDPDYIPAHRNIAAALKKQNRIQEMVRHLKYAQRQVRDAERRHIERDVRQGCAHRGGTTTVLLLVLGILHFGVFWR